MLDIKAQSQFADATATMLRACALAFTQTINASTSQGLWFWSELLRSSAEETARSERLPFAGNPWTVWALPGWQDSYRDAWASAPFAGPFSGPFSGPWASATLLSWQRLARWTAANSGHWQSRNAESTAAQPGGGGAQAFSSYRSAGGHAVAQIVAPTA